MEVMGSLGNFYIILLFLILIGGSGLTAFNFAKGFWEKSEKFMEKRGGRIMNKWIKLAITSFAGILIASFALGITNNLSGQDAHSAHGTAGTGQMSAGQVHGGAGQQTFGQMNQNPMSYDARLYQLQINMMLLQQELSQLMQLHASQYGNYGSVNSMKNY